MTNHHFLSYSRATRELEEIAAQLCDELLVGVPSYRVWLDTREIRPGQEWDARVPEAIATCDSLLFVMTRDSVKDQSVCKKEWTRALKCKKPIIPLKLDPDAELPFRLDSLQYIDFTGGFDIGLGRLRLHLKWLPSPEGVLQSMKDLLAIARYDLVREPDKARQTRIEEDIALLENQIASQQRIVDDVQGAVDRVEAHIRGGMDRERQPTVRVEARSRFINQPQSAAPSYFQDRTVETQLIGDFLKDDALRLIMVVGRGGSGKTAMVSRVLKYLERDLLPDDGGPLAVDGIIYLSMIGVRQINLPNIFADLLKLAPDGLARELETLYQNPQASTKSKMQSLFSAFPAGRIILLLDNFEDLIDPVTLELRDSELNEGLRALLEAPSHAVKVIITTRVVPRSLALTQPGRQRSPLYLDDGLPTPHAENLLREMDADGRVGLKFAPDELLAEARERTRGYPRALEALYMILSVDRDTSLSDILNDTARRLPDNVVQDLVGEAFSRLDPAAQQLVQALAIYGRPVTPTACDYLLQPYIAGVDSALVLKRLVNWLFVRKEEGRYALHPEDRAYALSRVPRGSKDSLNDATVLSFTQIALQRRGADYCLQTRVEASRWKTIDDLEPQLAEFELRCAGEDFDSAVWVLIQIGGKMYSWGHYGLLVEMHERIRPYIEDQKLRPTALNLLGLAYWKLALFGKAISAFDEALTISRELDDHASESSALNNLGLIYDEMGNPTRALQHYQEALGVAKLIHSRTEAALNNVGRSYSDIGETTRGLRFCCQSARVSVENGNRDVEAIALNNVGYLLADLGELDKAIYIYQLANAKADEIGCVQVQHHGRQRLALAYLLSENLEAARLIAESAATYEVPNDQLLKALLGLILLRQADRTGAQRLFAEALTKANSLLEYSAENYEAAEVKGLAHSGLAVCGETTHIGEATKAYKAAHSIYQNAGTGARALRQFEILARTDETAVLAPVRAAVFTFSTPSMPNFFHSPEFLEYNPTDAEQEYVTPPVSLSDEWLNVYFGHRNQPEERTQDFHRILEEDSLIDKSEFHDFVVRHRPQLGNLLIHHAGLLEVVSSNERGRRMFFVIEETIEKLFAL